MKGKCVLVGTFRTMLLQKRWVFLPLSSCECLCCLSFTGVSICGAVWWSHQLTEELKLTLQTKINYLKGDEMVRMCHLSVFVGFCVM